LADDADDKNFPSTSSDRSLRFKIGDVVRFSGKNAKLKQQYAGNLTIYEFSKSGDSCTCLMPIPTEAELRRELEQLQLNLNRD
jgi:hypothetical protein